MLLGWITLGIVFAAALAVALADAVNGHVLSPAQWPLVAVVLAGPLVAYGRLLAARRSFADLSSRNLEIENRLASLLRENRSVEAVLANMADGIIATNAGGVIVLFNVAASRIFDVRADEVVGKRLHEVELHPEITRLAYDRASSENDQTSEIRLPGRPQRVISIRSTAFQADDAPGHGAMVIIQDISEIKRHERNQKEFVSNVSHELRTPITGSQIHRRSAACGREKRRAVR